MLRAIDISTSGLVAQRQRMNTISENIANMNTTRNAKGEKIPFRRRMVTFQAAAQRAEDLAKGAGVKYQVSEDPHAKERSVHQPNHPDADESGYVKYPDINMIQEFVNALEASRAYEANLAALTTSKAMSQQSLTILN